MVVLPLVPVTPTRVKRCEGDEQNLSAQEKDVLTVHNTQQAGIFPAQSLLSNAAPLRSVSNSTALVLILNGLHNKFLDRQHDVL